MWAKIKAEILGESDSDDEEEDDEDGDDSEEEEAPAQGQAPSSTMTQEVSPRPCNLTVCDFVSVAPLDMLSRPALLYLMRRQAPRP